MRPTCLKCGGSDSVLDGLCFECHREKIDAAVLRIVRDRELIMRCEKIVREHWEHLEGDEAGFGEIPY